MPTTTGPFDFPVVGMGASAGGLAAFEAFFSGMPTDRDPGMAFVVVQHLAPDHKSILTELIRRYTRMQVTEVAQLLGYSSIGAFTRWHAQNFGEPPLKWRKQVRSGRAILPQ